MGRPFILIAAALLLSHSPLAAAGQPLIVVVKSRTLTPYTAALNGFKSAVATRGINPVYISYDLKGNRMEGQRLASTIATLHPALILAIGTIATETIKQNITDRPVLFCMVLNPVANGLVPSLQGSRRNVAGAALDIPVADQFRILKSVLPSCRSIGVIYDPSQTKAIIDEASLAARTLNIRLAAMPVSSVTAVPGALATLRQQGVDCLWAVSDSTVFSSFRSVQLVIDFSIRNRLPFIGISAPFVKAGAVMAITADPALNGRQAGDIAVRILSGEQPGAMPVAVAGNARLTMNAAVARRIGVRVPHPMENYTLDVLP